MFHIVSTFADTGVLSGVFADSVQGNPARRACSALFGANL